MASIPTDLYPNILPFLDVKDFLRFRCVSKFFKTTIDLPEFNKLHLYHSRRKNTNPSYAICKKLIPLKNPQFMLLDLNKPANHIHETALNPPSSFNGWEVVGSCDGLIVLQEAGNAWIKQIALWNPFTGNSKIVPKQETNFYAIPKSPKPCGFGFGYNPKSNDYKLVKISLSCQYRLTTLKAAIYSLKTNSWKELGGDWSLNGRCNHTNCEYPPPLKHGVLANNALHWLFDKWDDNNQVIVVAFDFVRKEFGYVPVLDCLKSHCSFKLGALDGCLTLSTWDKDGTYVWVMKEYGVEKSWTKILSCLQFDLSPHWVQHGICWVPLTYSRGCDKVLLISYDRYLFWYDLVNEKVESCFDGEDVLCREDVKPFKGNLVALNEDPKVAGSKRKHDDEKKDSRRRRR